MGKNVPFVHLHFHTEYSLLDSACKVKKAMKRAVELEQSVLAITDHGVLYGAIEFYKAAQAAGMKTIRFQGANALHHDLKNLEVL